MPLPDRPSVAIAGATGAVGRELLLILQERNFPARALRLLASPRSAGSSLPFHGESIPVDVITEHSFEGIDLVFFCAGSETSHRFAPVAVSRGAIVIDNSSAFRMDSGVPLVIPEINAEALEAAADPGIIASPNCSATIALVAVTPLHRAAGITRMILSTYQAASGAGGAAMAELQQQALDFAAGHPLTTAVTGRQLLFNLFSHESPVDPDGSNDEERKIAEETKRIWNESTIAVCATCIRVPVLRAHCESINLTFGSPLSEVDARELLAGAPGVRIVDDRDAGQFPEPIAASEGDEVLVGRLRPDPSQSPGMGLAMFVAGDQLRKGAALNAVQIAECLAARASRPGDGALGQG